jgi:hypothetical protein
MWQSVKSFQDLLEQQLSASWAQAQLWGESQDIFNFSLFHLQLPAEMARN